MFRSEGGRVIIDMSKSDYEELTLVLMAAAGIIVDRFGEPATNKVLALSNRLNEGNPEWHKWDVPERTKEQGDGRMQIQAG